MRPALRFSYTFPSGWPGAGLLIVRLAVASGAALLAIPVLCEADGALSVPWPFFTGTVVTLVASLLLCVGLLSPYAELALTIASFGAFAVRFNGAADVMRSAHSHPMTLVIGGITLGLALVGPGAYSIDAKLTGRHEIRIPPSHTK